MCIGCDSCVASDGGAVSFTSGVRIVYQHPVLGRVEQSIAATCPCGTVIAADDGLPPQEVTLGQPVNLYCPSCGKLVLSWYAPAPSSAELFAAVEAEAASTDDDDDGPGVPT